MKTAIINILLVLCFLGAYSQNITTNGASIKINIKANTYLVIPGNWNNPIDNSLTQENDSEIIFNGTTVQEIENANNVFSKIKIENTHLSGDYDVILNSDIIISQNLTLITGIINGNSNTLTFTNLATSDIGNAFSFVDSRLEKLSTSSFVFPSGNVVLRDIGDGLQTYKIWAPITIVPIAASNVAVKYNFSNDVLPQWWYHDWTHQYPLTHTTSREYWLVESILKFEATLYWRNNNPCSVHDFCNPGFLGDDLTIAYWDNIWIDTDRTLFEDDENGNVVSIDKVPGSPSSRFVTFGATDKDIPLPVGLTEFYGECVSNVVIIWRTATEFNNDYFILEKSDNSMSFYEIAEINGSGNSNDEIEYIFVDDTKMFDNNYYRLKQVNYDGKVTTYDIINVLNCNDNIVVSVYPNPFIDELMLKIENYNGVVKYKIYDVLGHFLFENTLKDSGDFVIVENSNLVPGTYFVEVVLNDKVFNSKIIKK